MRRMTSLALMVVMLFLLSVSMTTAQQEPASPPLQVVDVAPAASEIGLESPLTVYFDRPVNCESAQEAFMISPEVAGTVTCDDEAFSVSFTPTDGYDRGVTYAITFSDALHGADGSSLGDPFSMEVSALGFLEVSQVLPANDTTAIDTDSTITVIFNRPVVPLTVAEDADTLPQPLTFTPSVSGTGEWLNTSIYVFHPDPALQGGTEYTVTVDSDLTAVDGATMSEPFTWAFSTAAPMVTEVVPDDGASNVNLDSMLQVRFNQPMNQASTEADFSLHPTDDPSANVAGAFEWADDGAGFSFTPDDPLALGTDYTFGFTDAPLPEGGGSALTGESSWTFETVPLPAVLSTNPYEGQDDAYPDGGFRIMFASPMDPDSLKDKVVIEPEPFRAYDTYYSDYDNSYSLSFPSEPSTDYTVTILPGMKDQWGNEITTQTVVHFTTRPYNPDIILNAPNPVGFYNADNELTQVFLTHRNVSQVDLSLYSVPLGDFLRGSTGETYYDPATAISTGVSNLLKRWSIPSIAPLNQRRYELLNLGGEMSTECAGAPRSRLRVGDQAVVISDPDPVRARASAPDGEVITSLYKDYQLPITGGPLCANSIIWWEVTLRDGQTAWVAEGSGDEYFLDLKDAVEVTPVDITQADSEALKPGIYLLRISSPETQREMNQQWMDHVMVVANVNLTLKTSVDSMTVWATDVNTGEPIPNATIDVYGELQKVIASGTTDADGIAQIDLPRADNLDQPRAAVLQSDDYFGVGVTSWSQGIDPWYFGENSNYYPEEYRAYVYTDRPIYRPDQPVYFRGIVRTQDDVTYTPPSFDSIPVTITNDQGEVVYEETLALTPYGTFSGTFELDADAPLGYYTITGVLPHDETDQYYYQATGSVNFTVAEYRAPEFQVNVTAQTPEVVQGDTVEVLVDSAYFFGGAVANAKVEYTVSAAPYGFNYTGDGSYSFEDYNADAGPGEFYGGGLGLVTSGEGVTDADGKLVISFPADLQDATQSQIFTVEATVTDESDQAVSGRVSVTVHKGLLYVGVQPEEYVGVANEALNVNLIAVDWESQPIADQELDVTVVERRWSSVQEEDPSGRTTWTYEVEEIPVTTGTATTGADGKAVFSFTPPNGGVFKITAQTRDSDGNEIVASNTVWVSSSEYVTWRQQNSYRIDLITDKQSYEVGDTAEVLITSPFQGSTEALITVERGDVLRTERVTMDSNSYVYRFEIGEEDAPNVFVSAVLVKGVDENNPVASFRMGLTELVVDNSHKIITLDVSTDVETAGPGDTVEYTVKATDWQGNPVEAEVGVSLTDLAVLTISDPFSPPLLGFWYGQQGLSVRTSTPLTINTDEMTQTVLDTIKGGGGGFGEGGIFDIRQEFVDTPYWNAKLTTDAATGTATFKVTLPDNLTTWRLDARAVTASDPMLIGQTTFDLLSTKPVLIRPVTPRFFVVGDEVTLGAVVNNNTDEELSVDVTLQVVGVTVEGDATQTVTVPARGGLRVNWDVTVDDVPNVDFTFFANAGDGLNDASKPPLGQGDNRLLPVFKYEAPETVATGGILREGGERSEAISLPRSMDVTDGELTVQLDPSLAATTVEGLDYLQNYPYQCTEQTVSKFLPNIMTYRALASLGLDDADLKAQLDRNVNFALQRLYAQQKVDGGWGWYSQDASDALTTAYALIGLSEAKAQGFSVSDDVIRNARNFLRGATITPTTSTATWRLNRQAFVLYALARSGAPDIARTTTLFENRDRLAYYAKGFLAQALYLIDPNDTTRTEALLSDLVNGAALSANGAHWNESERDWWNWNTDTRTTAIALDTFVLLHPESDLIPNIVRYLMTQRKADAWETTQETAWAVMALTDWMVVSGELQPNYEYTAQFNGETMAQGTAQLENVTEPDIFRVQVAEMLADQVNQLVIGRTDGAGVLYYSANLRVYLPVPEIEPLDRGIVVERHYTMPDSNAPITSASVGENVTAHLTIIAPNDLHYVVIEDAIPAGTDAVNPNLNTSQQTGTQPEVNLEDPLSQGWGWWYFSNIEFRDEKVVLSAAYLPAGTYEFVYTIRAGLAGTYNVIPPVGYEFYFPDVYGRGAGSTFTIGAAES